MSSTRGDGKVRPSHQSNDGKIFSWDNPPPTGHPGEDYNCRCRAEPTTATVPQHEQFFRDKILAHEGGYVNHPNDPGGETNRGVTMDTWRRYSQRLFGIPATSETLRAITEEQAFRIYEEGYYKPSGADRLQDSNLGNMHADFTYNAGSRNSGRVLQRAINDLGGNVTVDGAVGPKTLAAANALDPAALYRAYRTRRIEHYENIIRKNPKLATFRRGWMSRANSFNDY